MKLTNRRTSETAQPRSGTVTVEFALTVPIALMLTFGLVEFARANMIRNSMQNAAYEGARAAIIPGGTADRAKAKANDSLAIVNVQNAQVTVTPPTVTNSTSKITVTIVVPLGENMWIVPKYFANSTMTKSCSLTRESTNSGH